MCILQSAPYKVLLHQAAESPPTYGPQIGFLGFVDVVVQGGEVVTGLDLVTLPPNHVGQAGALAGVLGAAEEEVTAHQGLW